MNSFLKVLIRSFRGHPEHHSSSPPKAQWPHAKTVGIRSKEVIWRTQKHLTMTELYSQQHDDKLLLYLLSLLYLLLLRNAFFFIFLKDFLLIACGKMPYS